MEGKKEYRLTIDDVKIIKKWFAFYDRQHTVPYAHTELGTRLVYEQERLEEEAIKGGDYGTI